MQSNDNDKVSVIVMNGKDDVPVKRMRHSEGSKKGKNATVAESKSEEVKKIGKEKSKMHSFVQKRTSTPIPMKLTTDSPLSVNQPELGASNKIQSKDIIANHQFAVPRAPRQQRASNSNQQQQQQQQEEIQVFKKPEPMIPARTKETVVDLTGDDDDDALPNVRNTTRTVGSMTLLGNGILTILNPRHPSILATTQNQPRSASFGRSPNTANPSRSPLVHPAPLPNTPNQVVNPAWKALPPPPSICISKSDNGIIVTWTMGDTKDAYADCMGYEIFAYKVTSNPPSPDNWRYISLFKAKLLPMAVTLTALIEGYRFYFAVRAKDVHKRYGPFSSPETW